MADDGTPEQEPAMRVVPRRPPVPTSSAADEDLLPGDAEDMAETEAHDPIRFPPLPLLSGTALEGPDGVLRPVAAVTVVVTATDGTRHLVELEPRYGAWWPPRKA